MGESRYEINKPSLRTYSLHYYLLGPIEVLKQYGACFDRRWKLTYWESIRCLGWVFRGWRPEVNGCMGLGNNLVDWLKRDPGGRSHLISTTDQPRSREWISFRMDLGGILPHA